MDNKINGTFINVIENLVGVNVEEMDIVKEDKSGEEVFGNDILKLVRSIEEAIPQRPYSNNIEITLTNVPFELYEALSKFMLGNRYEDTYNSITTFSGLPGVTVSTGVPLLSDSIYFELDGDSVIGALLKEGERIIVSDSAYTVTKGKHEGKVVTVKSENGDSGTFLVELESGESFRLNSNTYYTRENKEQGETE